MKLTAHPADRDLSKSYFADVDYKEARSFEDYILLQHDLEDAIFFSQRSMSAHDQLEKKRSAEEFFDITSAEGRTYEADWIAAVIKYFRCFKDSARTVIEPDIFEPHDGAPAAHLFFLDLRGKYIVHAMNGIEEAKVSILLPPPATRKAAVIDMSFYAVRRKLEGREVTQSFLRVAQIALATVEHRLISLHATILAKAQSENINTLYARAYTGITIPSLTAVKERTQAAKILQAECQS